MLHSKICHIRLGWKRLPKVNNSLLRKFINLGQKSFITLAAGVKVFNAFPHGQNKLECLSLSCFSWSFLIFASKAGANLSGAAYGQAPGITDKYLTNL